MGGASSTIAHLPEAQLKTLLIPIPANEEQKQICDLLHCIDQKNDLLARKRIAIQGLFRTLLHQLMTAQIRVNHLDLAEVEKLLDHA
jgi:type I restriction enzyme S subunit